MYKLVAKLGISRNAVVGALIALWTYASDHTDDGLLDLDGETLDAIAEQSGLTAALVAVGWLTVGEDGHRIPDFEKWLTSAKQRADTRARMQRHRARAVVRARDAHSEALETEKEKKVTEREPSRSPSLSTSLSHSPPQGEGCRGEGEPSTTAPPALTLTPEREAVASTAGVPAESVAREWERFKLWEFPRLVSDWDREWRRWVHSFDPSRAPAPRRLSLTERNEAALDAVFGPRSEVSE